MIPKRYVALIGSKKAYRKFLLERNLADFGDHGFRHVGSPENAEGTIWADYDLLHDAPHLKDLNKIIEIIKSRIILGGEA